MDIRTRLEQAGLLSGLVLPMLWLMAVGTLITALHRMVYVYIRARNTARL